MEIDYDLLDQADAVNYEQFTRAIRKDLQENVDQALQRADPQMTKTVQESADTLYNEMDKFQDSEKECGPQIETWENFKGNHQKLKGALEKLGQMLQAAPNAQKEETVLQACKETTNSFFQSAKYFFDERTRLVESNEKIKTDLKEIKQLLHELQQRCDKEEQVQQEIEKLHGILQRVDHAYKTAKEKKNSKVKDIADFLKHMKEKVSAAKKSISMLPEQVEVLMMEKKASGRMKSAQIISSSIDRFIGYLETKKAGIQQFMTEKETLKPEMDKELHDFSYYAAQESKDPQNDSVEKVVTAMVHRLAREGKNDHAIKKVFKSCVDRNIQKMGDFLLKQPYIRKEIQTHSTAVAR